MKRHELLVFLIIAQALPGECFEKVTTEQEASTLRPGRLFVQVLTEPETLIRIFEGLNLSFQMIRHLSRAGPALIRLPFDKDFVTRNYDHVGLDHWKRPHYARMPTMFSQEAPRYVRISSNENWLTEPRVHSHVFF